MTKMEKRLAHWLGAAMLGAVVCLAGCALPQQTPQARAAEAPAAVTLAPGEGLLIVKLANNRNRASTLFPKWRTLRLVNEDKQVEVNLPDRSDSSASHSLFVASVPPGNYRIKQIENDNGSNSFYHIKQWGAFEELFPGFRVEPGHLTDLGTVVLVRAHTPVNSRQHAWAHMDLPLDRAARLRQLAPALAAALGAQPTLGWNPDPRLARLQQTFTDLRSVSLQGNTPVRMPDGSLLFGEAFGRIALRSPEGAWSSLLTPTGSPIRALYAGPDGSLFAGADEGILLRRQAGRDDWELLPLPFAEASVLDIGPLPGSDQLMVILQTRYRFVALAKPASVPGDWTEIFSRSRTLFPNSFADDHGKVLRAGDQVYLMTGDGRSDPVLSRYDGKARTWSSGKYEEFGFVTELAATPNGTLVRFDGMPINGGRYFRVADPTGLRWEKRVELKRSFGPVLFASDAVGYVVRGPGPPAWETVDPDHPWTLWRTADAGHTWTETGAAPAFPGTLVSLGGPDQLAWIGGDGKFLRSEDGGKTWTLELAQP